MFMRLRTFLNLMVLLLLLSSCKSEYEQRLEEARSLRNQLSIIENRYYLDPSPELKNEINAIELEIRKLARVSGHEDMFLTELHLKNI